MNAKINAEGSGDMSSIQNNWIWSSAIPLFSHIHKIKKFPILPLIKGIIPYILNKVCNNERTPVIVSKLSTYEFVIFQN